MQAVKVNSLGYDLDYQVPSSVEEFDQLAKQAGACLREATNNIIYRSTLAVFRDTFCEKVSEATGIARKTKIVKPEVRDAEGKVTQEQTEAWDETEKVYLDRVAAELVSSGAYPTVEAAKASLAGLAQETINGIAFDPSKAERASAGPKKTPKTYVDTAKAIVEACGGDLSVAVQKFNAKNTIGLTLKPDASLDDLAAGVWKDQLAQAKARAASYAA